MKFHIQTLATMWVAEQAPVEPVERGPNTERVKMGPEKTK